MASTTAIRLARICAYSTSAPEWAEFVRRVTPMMGLAAWRVGLIWGDASQAAVDEIVQESFVKLCEDERRILREFEDRGNDSFLKLLRMVTASVATDYFRRNQAQKRGGHSDQVALDTRVEEGHWTEHSHRHGLHAVEWPTLLAQLDDLLRRYPETVSARDRNVFWLYYRQGMTAEAISRIPAVGLTHKGVESALQRLTRLLRETIEQGKPRIELARKFSVSSRKVKGFSPAIAIDSVERR